MERKEFLERFIFVRKCAGCKEILSYERASEAFCSLCSIRFQMAKAENCSECFRVITECTCAPKGLRDIISLRKLMFYHPNKHRESPNQMIYFLKRHANARVSSFLARELSKALNEEIEACGYSNQRHNIVLVHVPRGRRAKIRYGHDQSELICRALAEVCQISYLDCVVRSRTRSKEQKKLTGKKRFQNLKGAFALREGVDLSGKYVVLFDDIVTTGASMSECVKLFRSAGAKEVLALCIAQNEHKKGSKKSKKKLAG